MPGDLLSTLQGIRAAGEGGELRGGHNQGLRIGGLGVPGDQATSIPGGEAQLEEGSKRFQLYSNRAMGSGGRSRRRRKVQAGDRW